MDQFRQGKLTILKMILDSDIISEALPDCEHKHNCEDVERYPRCEPCAAWQSAQKLQDFVAKCLK